MKTSNPVFTGTTYDVTSTRAGYGQGMTVSGTVNKAGVLLLLVLCTAIYTWNKAISSGDLSSVGGYTMIGALGGFVAAMVTIFKKEWAGVTAPVYALLEGLFLGSISAMFEMRFPGIAMESVALTFGTCFAMLLAYRSGLVKPTAKFQTGIIAATGGIAITYFASMLLGLFHIQIPGIFGSGPIGIVFSLAVVAVAALNLILDFNFIEQGAYSNAPKYMEWYSAFGLMVTLVWLYLEILRLFSKIRDRR